MIFKIKKDMAENLGNFEDFINGDLVFRYLFSHGGPSLISKESRVKMGVQQSIQQKWTAYRYGDNTQVWRFSFQTEIGDHPQYGHEHKITMGVFKFKHIKAYQNRKNKDQTQYEILKNQNYLGDAQILLFP